MPTVATACRHPGRHAAGGAGPEERSAELPAADEQEERQHGAGQRRVDVLELGQERGARRAAVEVVLDRRGVAR
jgi:hypothetical protein